MPTAPQGLQAQRGVAGSIERDTESTVLRHHRWLEGWLASSSTYVVGSSRRACRPPAEDSHRVIAPPYNCARSRTIARPSPEPGAASSARTPRCSTFSRLSGAKPGPSSSTVIVTDPSVAEDLTAI